MIELASNRYGKSAIRLVKVSRLADRHVVRDLTVDVALDGDFAAAYVEGDNTSVVATDTMKNTVYALAKDRLDGAIERFGLALADHFLAFGQVDRATITIREHGWAPIPTSKGPAPDAFVRTGEMTRLARVSAAGEGTTIEAGIEDLVAMKTTRSSFAGFPRDRYTTLRDADDRIMATSIDATWRYDSSAAFELAVIDFDADFEGVRRTLLETLAEHESPSVQSSIWQIGRAVLEAHPGVDEIRMELPNLHHWLVDLAPFGLTNDREIFVATTEPHGLIEGTIRRTDLE